MQRGRGKENLGRGKSKNKRPEIEMYLVCSRNGKKPEEHNGQGEE